MPPTPDPKRDAEFEILVKELEALHLQTDPALAEIAPARIARRMRTEMGVAAAIKGAKMAINDALEMLESAAPEQRELANSRLIESGCPPLHVLMAGRAKVARHILRQRRISNELDYYLLREVILGPAAWLTEEQRTLGSSLLADYERRTNGAV